MSSRGPVGVGIVGCGGAAVDVAAAIGRSDLARIRATYDLEPALAAELAGPVNARVAGGLEELLADPEVEAVYVALPHDLLAPVAARALESGHHTLVEKPMATRLADIASLDRVAREQSLALGVFFELRYSAAAVGARMVVRSGAIGRVVQVRIRSVIDKPPGYWDGGHSGRSKSDWRARRQRAGGGVVMMNSIHAIDLVHAITGLVVERMAGETGTLMAEGVEVEDSASATFRLSNGAIGALVAAAHSKGASGDESVEIDGTLGSVRINDLYGSGGCSVYLDQAWEGIEPRIEPQTWATVNDQPADVYREATEDFFRAVCERRQAPVGAQDAEHALAAVLSLYQDAELRSQQ
jgi:UDP-N-acetylglucosamine 3-dehydrogenase